VYLFAAAQACPAFLFGILGSLLLLSRPDTLREWFWIVVSIGALALWFQFPDSLTQQTIRVSAGFFVGAFVVATLFRIESFLVRAMIAVLVAVLATVGWFLVFHLQFTALEHEIITTTWQQWRAVGIDVPAVMPSIAEVPGNTTTPDKARELAALVTVGASVFPALLSLAGVAGARLAWSWHHRIARRPFLAPAGRLRDFRFNDHLIWVVIAGAAVWLLNPSRGASLAAANVLIVIGALYAVRGAAVFACSLAPVSRFTRIILNLMLLALLIFSVLPLMLAVIGVADTWLDFRRRMAPPTGVPS